jgi:hypothetical protein
MSRCDAPVLATGLAGALFAGLLTAAPAAVAGPQVVDGGVIRTWTGLAMTAVRDGKAPDAAAARRYAMVDAAMFDAVNGVAGVAPAYSPVFVAPSPGTAGDPAVAAAAAAHDVLAALYPPDTAGSTSSSATRPVSPPVARSPTKCSPRRCVRCTVAVAARADRCARSFS